MACPKKIKVLWFSSGPANAIEFIWKDCKPGSGSWLGTLDRGLQKGVDLNIAFYHTSDTCFMLGETRYWGMARYDGKVNLFVEKIAERFFNKVLSNQHLDRYLSIIDEVKPDVIHIHGTENSFGAIIGNTDVPVVVSIQGLIVAVLNSYNKGLGENFLKVRNFSFNSLKNLIFPTHFENARLKFEKMAQIEKNNLRHAKYVIGRTDWDYRMSKLLAPQSAYFHNDEIMRDEFSSVIWKPRKSADGSIVVHTTADNVYYKGLETIVSAIIHLNEYGFRCYWRIAGVYPNDLIVKILKKKFGQSFPHKNLIWMGKLSALQLIDSMLDSDCYVLASNIENSPNSLCEAMLMGMPCVATNAGGVSTFINDQKNGLLIQAGDSYALASSVVQLKSSPKQSIIFGLEARREALVRHNSKTIVDDLIKIYHEISLQNK